MNADESIIVLPKIHEAYQSVNHLRRQEQEYAIQPLKPGSPFNVIPFDLSFVKYVQVCRFIGSVEM